MESFLGILAAFGLRSWWEWRRDNQNRKKLRATVKNELQKCASLLKGKGMLLPTMMWDSTITSGDVKLLSYGERTKLSSIHFEIENHNYEAKRVRDSAITAQTGSRDVILDGQKASIWLWQRLSKRFYNNEKTLRQKISELLEEPWWSE
ncbi:MAG: hypothetical protein JSV85_04610 [Candidatus Bathyarchaeota archaeon]|nr:MAG: hypothetical protein JSV85_04610 [Candidatus Bathyarchaeota archaeon]